MFDIAKILGGRQNVAETMEMPVKAGESYTVGEALTVSAGVVTKASGDVNVKYVAMENYTAPATGARKLLCFRVMPDQLFAVPISAYSATVQKEGAQVTIGADGLTVTATAITNGFGAEIVDMNGATAAGDKIFVVLR